MKTLLFTLEYPPFKGGVANVYKNIYDFWPEKDNIKVLDNNDNGLINNNYPILKWLPGFLKLKKEYQNNKFENVIVGHILPLGFLVYIFSKFKKIKYSVILHGMDFAYSQKNFRKRFLSKKILLNAENIICMNSYVANLVIKKLGVEAKHKIQIINPGVNQISYPSNNQFKKIINKYNLKGNKIIFSISRLVKRKGIDMVIKSMERIVQKIPNVIYFIAGAGPDEKYLKEIKNDLPKNIQDKIIFLGKIFDEEKWVWFHLCNIFAMPSREMNDDFEGFGIVYLEANLCSRPVIAGESGGIGDAVIDGYNGFRVNPEDTNDISNSIIRLLLDNDLRIKLGDNGRKRVLNDFKWDDKIKLIYNCINK